MEITRAWRSWTVGLGLIGALVSGLLFVGGILLLMRRAVSLQLLRVWALVRMVMVLVAVPGAAIEEGKQWIFMSW